MNRLFRFALGSLGALMLLSPLVQAAIPVVAQSAPSRSASSGKTSIDAPYRKLADGVVVDIRHGQAARIRLQVVGLRIIHVTAVPGGPFNLPASLMAIKTGGDAHFKVYRHGSHVQLSTLRITADVNVDGGRVRFLNAQGEPILAARRHGTHFKPVTVQGKHFYAIRQQFNSPADEAFYGLGQHQLGTMNYKGKDVELAQHNMDIAIPFVVSSRNYGLLWDNDSITRFGDPRPYRMIDKGHLKLFDANGKSGGLTATYYVDGKKALQRAAASINYEYLKDRKRYPKQLKGKKNQKVVWAGQIASSTPGDHKFRLYASGYTKVYIDGKRILDNWRQNWNPWYRHFKVHMTPGEKHSIRIVWIPQDGYIALDHLDPLPQREQDELSLFSQVGKAINYYFIAGKNMHQVIAGYRKVTGKAVMLPRWAYGFWQSRDHYTSSKQVLGTVKTYRRQHLPLDNIVQDWRYWKDNAWGSHAFDRSRYPHPKQMIDAVHQMHAHFMVSVWPKFYPSTQHFKELAVHNAIYMRHIREGTKDWVGPGYRSSFYDPYSKQGRHIYWRQIDDTLGKLGVDAWWMDATEPDIESNTSISERKKLMGPTAMGPGAEFFNSYPLMTTTAVYRGSRRDWPNRRVFILTRSAFAGQQRNAAASWSGDVASRWRDLSDQIPAGVNLSMSGIPNWTTDIGGYDPEDRYRPPHPKLAAQKEWRELYLRWFQFGAFCPLFRSHGQPPHREIYDVAPPGSSVYKALAWYDRLRYRLMPYIYTQAADTYLDDGTIMRGLVMDFPHDEKVRDINDEYLFGPAFLVAPVTHYKARSRQVYLPAGTAWYDFYSGKRYHGGTSIKAAAPLARMPLFVHAGAIVPTGPAIQYTHEKPNAPITLNVYTGADGHLTLYNDQGTSYDYAHGAYTQIPIRYDASRGTLTLGKRQGQFSGMTSTRMFKIRWIQGRMPQALDFGAPVDQSVVYKGRCLVVKRGYGVQ